MFLASKYEDITPLKMSTVFEKIGHSKLEISVIKKLELDIVKTINYKIHVPTVLDFLKTYLGEVLGISILSRTETRRKEDAIMKFKGAEDSKSSSDSISPDSKTPMHVDEDIVESFLIEKMAIYLAKMSMHD